MKLTWYYRTRKTLENAFEAAAKSVFGIMAELSQIRSENSIKIEFEEPDMS